MMIQSGLYRNIQQWLIPRIKYQRTLLNTHVEDKINTLLTGDPNKVKVYSEGFDGHCFRTFYYWKDQMPDIVDTVESINSIADKYPDLRSKSKAPSFA